jgi:hypothetical protein
LSSLAAEQVAQGVLQIGGAALALVALPAKGVAEQVM